MRLWIGHRLPFGFRGGISVPVMSAQKRGNGARSGGGKSKGDFVYVVAGAHGRVKIGTSDDPIANLRSLQRGSPFRLWLAYTVAAKNSGYPVEFAAHDILDKFRCEGEWFDTTVEAAIAAITTAAYRLNEPIVAIEPAMVSQAIALAAAEEQAAPAARRSKARFMLLISSAIALLAWFEIAKLNIDPEPVIFGSIAAELIFFWLMSTVARLTR